MSKKSRWGWFFRILGLSVADDKCSECRASVGNQHKWNCSKFGKVTQVDT